MSPAPSVAPSDGRARVDAEAAAWLARLRAPDRNAELEEAFRRWLSSDASHAAAFHRATGIWEDLGGAAGRLQERRRAQGRGQAVGLGLAGTLAAAVLAVVVWSQSGTEQAYATGLGEQRVLQLADGSKLTLNTASRVYVRYTPLRRRIRLEAGEALFQVASNRRRPFVVEALGREVKALGTTFVVDRHDGMAVTLIEGRVAISASDAAQRRPVVELRPNQRWRLADDRVTTLNRTGIEAALAWPRGEVLFDDTPLSEAVAQMNRYGRAPIVLRQPAIGRLRVSGIFHASEGEAFARTVAAVHDLGLTEEPDRLVLETQSDAREKNVASR